MSLSTPSAIYGAFEGSGVEIDPTKWGLGGDDFVEVLEQHRKVVEVAVKYGMGLLGHGG